MKEWRQVLERHERLTARGDARARRRRDELYIALAALDRSQGVVRSWLAPSNMELRHRPTTRYRRRVMIDSSDSTSAGKSRSVR